jgi:protein-tyrosine phosphatase
MIEKIKSLLGRGEPDPRAAEANAPVRVLFVCMGNICRSPTAEGVLRVRLAAAGLKGLVGVESAGTHAMRGSEPDPRAAQVALKRGYDLSRLRARQVVPEDFERFDRILAMDEDNVGWLAAKAPPGARCQPELLMRYSRRFRDIEHVPDPYYGAPDGFDRVLDLLEDACDGVIESLQRPGDARAGAAR